MPEPRILADEHIPKSVVKRLTSAGIDAIHVDDADLKGKTDTEIASYANKTNRAIVTLDNDFKHLIETGQTDTTILYFTRRTSRKQMADNILTVFNHIPLNKLHGQIIHLPWDD